MKKILYTIISILLIFSISTVSALALTPTYTVSPAYKAGIYYQRLINVTLTGDYATDIVNVACSQLDYHEGGYAGDVSGLSVGSGNYTEYCSWYGYATSWCAIFISWCARQARVPESVIKTNAIASGMSCNFGETKYMFSERPAQKGYIAYINNDSDPESDHVALVMDVDDTFIYTLEGNASDRVRSHKYYKTTGAASYSNATKIIFFGAPNYGGGQTFPRGDVNGDGKVTSNDALLLLDYSVGKRTLTQAQKSRADLDGNGKYNSNDAFAILKIVVQTNR